MPKSPGDIADIVPDFSTYIKKFMVGGFVSSFAVTLMAPLERAKIILQIQRMSSVPPSKRYNGILDVLRRIPKEQGFLAYWRGNTASIIRCFPYSALNFSLRDVFRAKFYRYVRPETLRSRILLNLLAGGVSGSAALAVIYPLDYARTRLALDYGRTKETREYTGLWSCLKDTFKTNGIKGIYRGFVISILGVFAYRSVYFGMYDSGIDMIPPHLHNTWTHFILAEMSAVSGGMISYPADTVRRCMMLQSGSTPKSRPYKSNLECAKHIYHVEGIPGFFRGNLINVARSTGGSIMLVMYEYINVNYVDHKSHNFFRKA